MPKIKLFLSLALIVLAVALVGGATLAWFTAATDPLENVFEAGTVEISAERTSHTTKNIEQNWNPGDCTDLGIKVENIGTKSVFVRSKLWERWLPSALRTLVIYTGDSIQLVALEWDSTCKGCTGLSGPIATGKFNYSTPFTEGPSYMKGILWDIISKNNSLGVPYVVNGEDYKVWCLDSQRTISKKSSGHDVQIFDPFCNENWYEEIPVSHNDWNNLPWAQIVYIVNNVDKYIEAGYIIMDIQQAIWHFTNGGFWPDVDGVHNIFTEANAYAIIADVNANSNLSTDNVNITMNGWTKGPDDWWYFNGKMLGSENDSYADLLVNMEVCLDGRLTDNDYQGAQYWLTLFYEAIQSSHEAAFLKWKVGYFDESWYPVVNSLGVTNTIYFNQNISTWVLTHATGTYHWGAPNLNEPNAKDWILQ
jgi:predicted ribosomally synthesized peptide with SipW-like signal peptide